MDADVDALYGLPRDEFISRRGVLAKSLRKDGRRDEAARVAALRKPSVAAWAVNQLVRTQRSSVHELFDAGDALRDAQSDLLAGQGDGRALRSASERERAAVEDLVGRARGLLSSAGDELSPAVVERVSDTLHAAALDEGARDQVRDGRLERELRHAGLGLGLGESAAIVPAPRRPRANDDGSAAQDGAAKDDAPAAKRAETSKGKGTAKSAGGSERGAGDADVATSGAQQAGAGAQADTSEGSGAKATAAPKRAAAKRERERAEAERAAGEQARRERRAAVKAARAAEVAARRRGDVAARALAKAEALREQAAQALSDADDALAAAREDAQRADAAHEQAEAELDDAERRR